MLHTFFTDILIDPATGNQLIYNAAAKTLIDNGDGKEIEITASTPIFISRKTEETDDYFQYIRHYNSDAENNDYFQEEENKITAEERRRSRQAIIKEVPHDAKLILDIGCGSAWVAAHFTAQKVKVISLDVSTRNPLVAHEKYNNEYHSTVVADSLHLPFASHSVDVIIASEVLEHLEEPAKFVEEWLRVLKPGGSLIMLTPYNEKRVFHTCIHCHQLTPANAHLHSVNEKNIRHFLPTDFSDLRTKAFNNKTFTKLRLYFLLRFLPYTIWSTLDSFLNKIVKTASLFLITIKK